MRLTNTTQMIAIVNAVIGITTIPHARKILRVCALHGFFAQDLADPVLFSVQLMDSASISLADFPAEVPDSFDGMGVNMCP